MSDPRTGIGSPGTLGRYHLADPLGGGPTGEVFRAKVYGVAGFERQFAVKRFHATLVADPRAAERIAAAARAYATIEHPRIARMHEYGVAAGQTFVAVELVTGIDLARLIGGTWGMGHAMQPGAAIAILSQAARSMGYAHERGVLHLGLCPTNVLVTPEGDPKLTDFGFLPARLPTYPAEDPTLAARLPYLAPEQVTGGEASPATDVFQLAALGYELVTGVRAFRGRTTVELAAAILAGAPPDAGVPPHLYAVFRRAMSPSPAERHPHATALAEDLDGALRRQSVTGGRLDVAGAVRAVQSRADELQAAQASGAVTFPMPAPPPSSLAASYAPPPPTTASFPLPAPPPSLIGVPLKDVLAASGIEELPRIPDDAPLRTAGTPPPLPVDVVAFEADPGIAPVAVGPADIPIASPESMSYSEVETIEAEPDYEEQPTSNHVPAMGGRSTPSPMRVEAPPEYALPPPSPSRPPLPEVLSPFRADAPPQGFAPGQQFPPPQFVPGSASSPPQGFASSSPPQGFAHVPPSSPPQGFAHVPPSSPPQGFAHVPASSPPQGFAPAPASSPPQGFAPAGFTPSPLNGAPFGAGYDGQLGQAPFGGSPELAAALRQPEPKRRVAGWLIGFFLLAGVGIGCFFGYQAWKTRNDGGEAKAPVTTAGTTPAPARAPGKPPAATTPTGAPTGTAPANAVVAAAPQGTAPTGTAPAPTPAPAPPADIGAKPSPPAPDGKLVIESAPRGASVYLDGALKGNTPLELPATGDRHKLAIVLSGHKLHRAEVDGSSRVTVTLEPVDEWKGPAGIKVKCKAKNRFYVTVDGKDTGMVCPTERIPVEIGPHTVDVFDPVTETTKTHQVNVEDTHNSVRVKVEDE